MRSRRTAAGVAALVLVAAVPGGADGAARSVSYSGASGQSVYASFVIKGGKVTGLFVGGVCLPNTSLVEPGVNTPLPISGGRFVYNRANATFGATVRAQDIGGGRYRVRFTLRNKRADARCSYAVIARRTGPR